MENSNFEKEENKNDEKEKIIQKVRNELLLEKQQLQNTADITDLKIEEIGEEEAELWLGCKAIKTHDDCKKFEETFNIYRDKISKETKEKNLKGYLHPKGDFVSVLANRLTYLSNKFFLKK